MDHLFETRFSELLVTYGEKIALAIICLIVGKIVINLIIGAVGRVKYFNNVDQTAKGYINSFLKIGLWVVLLIIVIQILGVPMASVITVLASATDLRRPRWFPRPVEAEPGDRIPNPSRH